MAKRKYKTIEFSNDFKMSFTDFKKSFTHVQCFRDLDEETRLKELKTAHNIAIGKPELNIDTEAEEVKNGDTDTTVRKTEKANTNKGS